jgi:hypothetical protein
MVEREGSGLAEGHPLGRCRIVLSDRMPSSTGHEKDDAGGGLPRVAVGPRVDPDQSDRPRDESGLFPELPHDGFLDRLPILDKPPR